MWSSAVLSNAPCRSMLAAIVMRAMHIRIKSRLALSSSLGQVEHARVGVLASEHTMRLVVRHFGHALLSLEACGRLVLVWIDCPRDSFESIVSERLVITRATRDPVDIIVDFDSLMGVASAAELQRVLGQWLTCAPPGTPIVSLSARWQRVLAHVDSGVGSDSPNTLFFVEDRGQMAKLLFMSANIEMLVPKFAVGLWTTRMGALSETAMPCELRSVRGACTGVIRSTKCGLVLTCVTESAKDPSKRTFRVALDELSASGARADQIWCVSENGLIHLAGEPERVLSLDRGAKRSKHKGVLLLEDRRGSAGSDDQRWSLDSVGSLHLVEQPLVCVAVEYGSSAAEAQQIVVCDQKGVTDRSRWSFEPVRVDSHVDESKQVMMIPIEAWKMQGEQQDLACVFDEALDVAALEMSKPVMETGSSYERAALAYWNDSSAFLGATQVCVWVHDPRRETRGIWRAAMDAFKTGSSVWPV